MLAASSRDWHNLAVRAPALNSPALSPADRQRLDELHARLTELRPRNIGYPCNQAYDITELFRFLHFSANNVGDPFSGTNYRLNTHDFEREVLADFARFTHAPQKRNETVRFTRPRQILVLINGDDFGLTAEVWKAWLLSSVSLNTLPHPDAARNSC